METEIPIEELDRVIRQLPPSRRREVLRFIEFLEYRDEDETESLWQAVEVHQTHRAAHLDEAQGYYFSRPVLPQRFARLLSTGIPAPTVAVHQ